MSILKVSVDFVGFEGILMNDEFPNPDYGEANSLDLDVLAKEVWEDFMGDFNERLQPEILKRFDAFVEGLKQVPFMFMETTPLELRRVLEGTLQKIATNVEIEVDHNLKNLKKAYITTLIQVRKGFDKALRRDISSRLFLCTKELEEGIRTVGFSGTISEALLEKMLKHELQRISQTILVDTIVQRFEKTLTPEAQVQFNEYIDTKIRPEINNGNVIGNLEMVLMNKIKKAPGMWRDEKKLLLKQITAIENAFVSKLNLPDNKLPIKKTYGSSILQESFKELRKRPESKLLAQFFAKENVGKRLESLNLDSLREKIDALRNQVAEYFDAKFIDHFRSYKNDFDTALADWKKNKQDRVQTIYIHFASMIFLHISKQLSKQPETKNIT